MSFSNWNSEPKKTSGEFHSAKGNAVETVGNLTGVHSWQRSGQQEHASGEAEIKAAQAKGYAQGGVDRLEGKKDSMLGSLTGDKSKQAHGNMQHDKGEAKQDFNRNY